MNVFTEARFIGNELWRFVAFFAAILASLVAGKVARHVIDRESRREHPWRAWLGVLLRSVARSVIPLTFALGVWLITELRVLVLPEGLASVVGTATSILYTATIGYAVYCLVDVVDFFLNRWADRTASRLDNMLVPLVGKSVRTTVIVMAVLQLFQAVSDRPITTILAGLGVGGLAVALAGQDTIRNFFGSLVILGDKPYEIGDRIVFDGHDGPVESVGFRSTKVRTLDGHLITVPNSEMVNRTVQNIGKRPFIKRVANVTITYDTPPAKVERALEILKEILSDHEGMRAEFPPRIYFSDFNDCSLNLLVIYWYHPPEYWDYMAFSERVNMEILTRFNAEGIEFAFPTQTVHLAGAKT